MSMNILENLEHFATTLRQFKLCLVAWPLGRSLWSLCHKSQKALSQAFSGMRSFSWLRGRAMDQRGKWRALLPENDPTKSKGQNLRRPNLSDMCILTLCLFCILFKDRQVGQQFRNSSLKSVYFFSTEYLWNLHKHTEDRPTSMLQS